MANSDHDDTRSGRTADAPPWVRGAAHDLNQLLSSVLGRAQLLAAHTDDPDLRSQLAEIESAARDAAVLVRRILEPGRAPAGETPRPLAVAPLLDVCLARARLHCHAAAGRPEPALDVRRDVPADLRVLAPPTALRQVLTNLLVNALEAMPEGGRLELSADREGERAVVRLRDAGGGMDADVLAAFRAGDAASARPGGHGLGLAGSRELLAGMGGALVLESEAGRGTAATVTLPAAAPETAGAAGPAPAADGPGGTAATRTAPSLRCLVVDDERRVRDLVTEMLALDGHAVSTAAGAEAALAEFRPGAWDLVLADLVMPGTDGLELARRMRELDPEVVIGLVSGWGGERAVAEADRNVVDLEVGKPLDLARLREAAAAAAGLLRGRRAHGSA